MADAQIVLDDLLEDPKLGFFVLDVDKSASVSHADVAVAESDLNLGREFQQAQEVGDGGAALADLSAQLFLGEAALINETLVRDGHFDGVEVLAVDVLDEGELKHLFVVGDTDECRDF